MGKRTVKLDDALRRLVTELRKGPRSARVLHVDLGCSKPTVYAWIEQLKARGYGVGETATREGVRGPKAVVYELLTEPQPVRGTPA